MKRLSLLSTLVLAIMMAGPASANLIKNGSFENNSANATIYNMNNATFNATVNDATAYGAGQEIDLMTFGGGFGLNPVAGSWHLAVHSRTDGTWDAFSFDLNGPINAGSLYTLSFWATANTTFDAGTSPLEIGISGANNSFGTLAYSTGVLNANNWTFYTTTFAAQASGNFITVRPTGAPNNTTWVHIDDFSMVLVPEPGSLAALPCVAAMLFYRRRRR